ncbi:Protein K10H10.10 [Aphelenchoides avenae]|nr:Protein K10H10.10 [Aphelenchus avenae]
MSYVRIFAITLSLFAEYTAVADDPSCSTLKTEYERICFKPPPPQAVAETEAFCSAFRSGCKSFLAAPAPTKSTEDPACGTLKTEYEKICFRPPPPQAAAETEAFCTAFRSSCKSLVATPSKANDDPACGSLNTEYQHICFRPPPPQAVAETEAFCSAFRSSCPSLLATQTPTIRVDPVKYCNKHRERFRYVCPNPTRFGKYTQQAIQFCPRYQSICPNEELPSEPEPFRKAYTIRKFRKCLHRLLQAPKDKHIYIRELQYVCDRYGDFAKDFCVNPIVLKLPYYQKICYFYKINCIDPLTKVIYNVNTPW